MNRWMQYSPRLVPKDGAPAKGPPRAAPEDWLDSIRASDWVEVRAGLNSGHGVILGDFQVFRVTPTGRFNVNGWSWARGAMVFNSDGHQRGAEGPGTAAIFPPAREHSA